MEQADYLENILTRLEQGENSALADLYSVCEQMGEDRVELLHQARVRLNEAIDPSFDSADVPNLNIEPPAATGLPAGVAPEAIADPSLRATYETSIARNQAKAAYYRRQVELRRLLAQLDGLG